MKKSLRVSLHVQQPSVVELTVTEPVQMDRLAPTPEGYVTASCGELLIPGVTTLALEQGIYLFETGSEAHLRIIRGDVDAVTTSRSETPMPVPLPPGVRTAGLGDELSAEPPAFTVD
jgi:hypothetical protein